MAAEHTALAASDPTVTALPAGADADPSPSGVREARSPFAARLRDLLALTKPRLSLLVLVTCGGGIFLAPGKLTTVRALVSLLATSMVVGAANALNNYIERDLDRLMSRTRNRPLPAGRLDPRAAPALALALGAVSLPLLALLANPLTAILAAVALATYVLVYTPMKQRSPLALWAGAIPGAIPPLMGWTAVRGRVEIPGLVLFAILFVWQVPHFIAIALNREEDYAAAGHRILSLCVSRRAVKLHATLWTALLLPATLALYPLGIITGWAAALAGALGVYFLFECVRGFARGSDDRKWARRLFGSSLMYLTALVVVLSVGAA